MSAAKKCDRCGKLYEEYNVKNDEKKANGIKFLNIDSRGDSFGHAFRDLCPECMGELKAWFDDPSVSCYKMESTGNQRNDKVKE